MSATTYTFGSHSQIGLIVRGKAAADHHPGTMEQHADCILEDGSPVGFFGHNNDSISNSGGLGMDGVVYTFPEFQRYRPHYVNFADAVAGRVVSTVLLVSVSAGQAAKFRKSWSDMTRNPGSFNILGGNCATHASAAFIDAGIVESGIPWLDTPDNLYIQLVEKMGAGSCTSISGHIGFATASAGGYTMQVEPYLDSPTVNRPRPSGDTRTSVAGGSSSVVVPVGGSIASTVMNR